MLLVRNLRVSGLKESAWTAVYTQRCPKDGKEMHTTSPRTRNTYRHGVIIVAKVRVVQRPDQSRPDQTPWPRTSARFSLVNVSKGEQLASGSIEKRLGIAQYYIQ